MSYVPNQWQCNDVITDNALNHMEQGIAEASEGRVCNCNHIDEIIERTISGTYINECATLISACAFHNCNLLEAVEFPNVSEINGKYAFLSCSALTSASFANATVIDVAAFDTCILLEDIYFPKASIISESAFRYCTALKSANFPMAEVVGSQAFCYCSMLSTVSFPQATIISKGAFAYCNSLEVIELPMASTIDEWAMQGDPVLKTISLPRVTAIGQRAFKGCSSLMSAYFLGSSVPTASADIFSNTPMTDSSLTGSFGSIFVPASLVTTYQSATVWSEYASRITAYI